MAKIYDSIMPLIKPGRIASAAATLGETEQKVSAGVDIILPSLLAMALKKGDSSEIRDIVTDASKLKMFENYNQIWEGDGIFDGKNIGVRLENQLLGTSNPAFYSAVASRSGLQKNNANRLTSWVAGTIAAFFGEKISQGKSYAGIIGELAGEKDELRRDMPSAITDALGLGSLFGAATAHKTVAKTVMDDGKKKKGRLDWLMWLALILLIVLLLLWWRSCDRKKAEERATDVVEQTIPPDKQAAVEPGTTDMPNVIRFTLPDGSHITAFKGGCEECIMNFLKSDRFKNATEEELANTWFEFDNINYEHNSATEFMPGSEKQVRNLAAILKNYPDLKIRIGAFADATGTRAVNFAITEKRAANIKAAFEKAGIDASRISTEGFGKQFAEVPATAPDSKRMLDRDIALRLTR